MTLSSPLCTFSVIFHNAWSSFIPHVCVLASRKDKKNGKDTPSLFKAASRSCLYHFHFHHIVEFSHVKHSRGNWATWSLLWAVIVPAFGNNMGVFWKVENRYWGIMPVVDRIIIPQRCPSPSEHIYVFKSQEHINMLLYMAEETLKMWLRAQTLRLGDYHASFRWAQSNHMSSQNQRQFLAESERCGVRKIRPITSGSEGGGRDPRAKECSSL